jgi:hypothetical protein
MLETEILNIREKLEIVTGQLDQLFEKSLDTQLSSLSPLESSELLVLLSLCINTLSFVYLKLNGISPSKHPVRNELKRCRDYFEKINSLVNRKKLDIDTAKRFIQHGISTQS